MISSKVSPKSPCLASALCWHSWVVRKSKEEIPTSRLEPFPRNLRIRKELRKGIVLGRNSNSNRNVACKALHSRSLSAVRGYLKSCDGWLQPQVHKALSLSFTSPQLWHVRGCQRTFQNQKWRKGKSLQCHKLTTRNHFHGTLFERSQWHHWQSRMDPLIDELIF